MGRAYMCCDGWKKGVPREQQPSCCFFTWALYDPFGDQKVMDGKLMPPVVQLPTGKFAKVGSRNYVKAMKEIERAKPASKQHDPLNLTGRNSQKKFRAFPVPLRRKKLGGTATSSRLLPDLSTSGSSSSSSTIITAQAAVAPSGSSSSSSSSQRPPLPLVEIDPIIRYPDPNIPADNHPNALSVDEMRFLFQDMIEVSDESQPMDADESQASVIFEGVVASEDASNREAEAN